ncbi:sensor domain-containing diguanylate cyclase [Heliobacterium mobile]|nr:diguanylate cyclase [Heliobacterium mobile]
MSHQRDRSIIDVTEVNIIVKPQNVENRYQPLSLIKGILVKIFLMSIAIVTVVSLISYYNAYHRETEERLEELTVYVSEHVRTESEIFRLAKDNLDVFSQEFLKLYQSDIKVSEQEFWSYYFVDNQGATRMKREYFDGFYTKDGGYIYGLSSFIGNNQSAKDPDFQRRLILAGRVLSRMGPAWVNRFANVHVAYPENAITLFYPVEPWGLHARADLPMNELGVIRAVNKKENPERKAIWSGLYYDETAKKWMVTYMAPLDEGDRHLITPGHDIYLTDLVDKIVENNNDGTYNFIIRKDGYLVAHPSDPTDDQKWVGQLSLDKINSPFIKEAYRLIQEETKGNLSEVKIIKNNAYDCYLAVGQFEGPEWLLVRVFPMKIIREAAHAAAIRIFTEGMMILTIILFIVYYVMRYQAEKPLKQLTLAAEAIGRGEYQAVAEQTITLPVQLDNEIGLLSTRFVEMATNIRDAQENLERIVEERTKALEQVNADLVEMSLLDGLTGIHNRRSFDRSMTRIFTDGKDDLGTFSIMMVDIDFFKNFNDTYGHAEGDQVLKSIANTIKENIRAEDRVFRYGGEEFVVIFSHANLMIAKEVADRILQAIKGLQIVHRQSPHGMVTISGGIEEFDPSYTSAEEMLRVADSRLYHAKKSGKNRIVFGSSAPSGIKDDVEVSSITA